MRRACRLLGALAAGAIVLLAASALTVAAPVGVPSLETLTLRLPDLPPGYGLVSSSRCGVYSTHRCEIAFEPRWRAPSEPPGPALVVSGAVAYADAGAARGALGRPRATVAGLIKGDRDSLQVVEPAPTIGDEAALLTGSRSSAWVVWRSGSLLAYVWITSRTPAESLAAAVPLANAQQARIASPSPLLASDLDDLEVPLDDPHLDRPVYWLGRALSAAGRYPRLPLREVVPASGANGHGWLGVTLSYGADVATGASISLSMLDPKLLRRPGVRRELRRISRERCTIVDRLRVPHGRATIFTGDRSRCPHYGDDAALVRFPGVLVIVVPDGCQNCRGPVSRYQTRAGMRTIVRALRLREPRPLSAPAP